MKTRSSLVISILLLLFGLGSLYYGISALLTNSSKWPTVLGKVTSANVNFSSDSNGTNYYVYVAYAYTVNGTEYTGSYPTANRSTSSDAQKDLQTIVKIYYDPNNISNSTNSPGDMLVTGLIGLAAGLFFIGAGGWSLRSYFVKGKAPKTTDAMVS